MSLTLYTDGGIAGANPSPVGGAYTFLLIENEGTVKETVLHKECHSVTPDNIRMPVVTSPNVEVAAIAYGLDECVEIISKSEYIPLKDRKVLVRTDCQVAMEWMRGTYNKRSIPGTILIQVDRVLRRLDLYHIKVEYELLAGHPNRQNLAEGFRMKGERKYPVSKHNVTVDLLCQRACQSLLEESKNAVNAS
jgi:ribonuclease HI